MLQQAIDSLATPIAPVVDPAQAQAELEETRRKMLAGAKKVAELQQSLNITLREYAKANRIDGVKIRGRNLITEIDKEYEPRPG